jgi:integrase
MQLVFATEEFVIEGNSYPGFPIVLHDSMDSCTPANRFLRYHLMRGAIGSERSWATIGQAIYDYFAYLQARKRRWDDPRPAEEQGLVGAYRDYCLDRLGHKKNTVSLRLTYICLFYEYALRQGWIGELPYGYEEREARRKRRGRLSHTDNSGGKVRSRDVSLKRQQQLPEFLSKDDVRTLLAGVKNPHHKLLIRLALQTGLRREELATFPEAYVFNPTTKGTTTRNIKIRLDPNDGHGMDTKGSKPRHLFISRRLMQDLYQYKAQLRGERASLSKSPQKPLFINQDGMPFAAHGKGIERIIRNIGQKCGIQVHPHMLRHTYATHTLYAMRRSNQIEPLIYLQKQLGHESIEMTLIYAHVLDDSPEEAVLAYDDELNDWIDA